MTSTPSLDDALAARLRHGVRDVPDYPRPGIVFKDITPLLGTASLFSEACRAMAAPFVGQGVTHIAAIESRGFLFAGPIAHTLGAGVVPVRKRGKLPYQATSEEYALEYGVDALEMHVDALPEGARVLIVDDVLATGGTAAAACRLAERVGGVVVGLSFLIRLGFLDGAKQLKGRTVSNLIVY